MWCKIIFTMSPISVSVDLLIFIVFFHGLHGAYQTENLPLVRLKAGAVNTISVNASFNKIYHGTVKQGKEYIFAFSYSEFVNKTVAVRVQVSSTNATGEYPVLYVVRQQRSILSWQIPLYLEKVYEYYTVSRTLCPVQRYRKSRTEVTTIYMDISSASVKNTSFTLNASLVTDFELKASIPKQIQVSPSEPKYYQYEFPQDVDSVEVRVTSTDDLCAIVSIQDINCPVYDLDRNVQFTGQYQTMATRATVTVQKSEYNKGIFYVVFVVKPRDFECSLIETIRPVDEVVRLKNFELEVIPNISVQKYYIAVFSVTAWFGLFYVAALIISLIYHICGRSSNVMSPEADASDGGPNPNFPINSDPSDKSYGATSPTASNFERGANGIPHRIPPPDDDDSSIDETDIDMLHDVDDEKEIIRTKTLLYVSDLARKDRKYLSKKYKLYHWNLITIAIFYGLPVIQLVITYQKVLHVTGDEDICYYNFQCAHPLGVISAFNNIYSNIGYGMLGILFLILTWRRDMMHKKAVAANDRYEKQRKSSKSVVTVKYYGIPQHFGLFYAMGIALIMEGILSGCYHVCPSYSNFQFDTSFMYMIAWLCMLKIYQTRHPDINPRAHMAYFSLALVIFVAVIGVVYASVLFWVLFFALHVFVTLIVSAQIYYMGRWKLDGGLFVRIYYLIKTDLFAKPLYTDRMILLIIGTLVNWSFALFGLITQPKDFASYLLAIFIVNLLLYVAFYIIMKLRSGEKILLLPMCYIISASVVWGFALYFFMSKLTSWEVSPAKSREGNQDCMLLDFYDAHDVWHFLSSMALFLSFMILLTLDDDLIFTPRDRIPVF